jgi:hypothetical protein
MRDTKEKAGEPSRSNEVFGLDLACSHLARLRRPFYIGYQLLLLTFELDTFTVQLALCFFESSLILGGC